MYLREKYIYHDEHEDSSYITGVEYTIFHKNGQIEVIYNEKYHAVEKGSFIWNHFTTKYDGKF